MTLKDKSLIYWDKCSRLIFANFVNFDQIFMSKFSQNVNDLAIGGCNSMQKLRAVINSWSKENLLKSMYNCFCGVVCFRGLR